MIPHVGVVLGDFLQNSAPLIEADRQRLVDVVFTVVVFNTGNDELVFHG